MAVCVLTLVAMAACTSSFKTHMYLFQLLLLSGNFPAKQMLPSNSSCAKTNNEKESSHGV